MENLNIQRRSESYYVPGVFFDGVTGRCSIEGESYLEDTFAFYEQLKDWVRGYFAEGGEELVLTFKLTYFNTSSSRAIVELLLLLKEQQAAGKNVKVVWMYPEPDDNDMLMEAEDFQADTGIAFELVEYSA